MKLLRAGPFKRGCKAAPFERTIPKKNNCWHSLLLWKTTDVHWWIVLSTGAKSLKSLGLTNIAHRRRPGVANAVNDSTPGDPNLKGHAALAVVLPKGDSYPAARPVTTHVMDALTHIALVRQIHRTSLPCSNLSAWPNLAPTCARLFLLERDGHFYHRCSPDRIWLCGNPPRDNWRDKRRCHQPQRCR